jgi:hypothetical protein
MRYMDPPKTTTTWKPFLCIPIFVLFLFSKDKRFNSICRKYQKGQSNSIWECGLNSIFPLFMSSFPTQFSGLSLTLQNLLSGHICVKSKIKLRFFDVDFWEALSSFTCGLLRLAPSLLKSTTPSYYLFGASFARERQLKSGKRTQYANSENEPNLPASSMFSFLESWNQARHVFFQNWSIVALCALPKDSP